ncbi:IPT/TIG domain-containing protein [Hymenobacter sp. ASUV-10]|uniref:IPT/TIG domain-containing protein n=1 Tax=Hymenobacter aranciens TaxID=3063996 RepID=A0ABT9BH77_9BACT|nr:IPT/TIG domain-containing protein [Hymenobacter sp. ASUV-10]MDO7877626.1 IPT/TIG domain-containing protein [Hymenobacter sp. ASUV-10]
MRFLCSTLRTSGLAPWLGLLIGLLGLGPHAQAQTPAWLGVVGGTAATGVSWARATALDARGNTFVVGSFGGQLTLGSTVLTSAGGTDVFVAKWDAATAGWAWAARAGGTGSDTGLAVAVDGNGDVVLTGLVTNAATSAANLASNPAQAVQVGGVLLPSASANTTANQDVLVAKYSAGGTYLWAASAGGTADDGSTTVAVDASNNVRLAGIVRNAATSATNLASNPALAVQFGGVGLNSASTNSDNNQDIFVAGYSASGSYQWATSAGGRNSDGALDLAVDGNGDVVVVGSVADFNNGGTSGEGVRFGTLTPPIASTSSVLGFDVFVAKYRIGSGWQWAVTGGGQEDDAGYRLALDGSNNVFVSGYVTNAATSRTNLASGSYYTVKFGGVGLNSASTNTGPSQDVYLAKYSSSGTYQWATSAGGSGDDHVRGLAVDAAGNVLLTGYVTSNSSVKFGGVALANASSSSSANQDVFVARYSNGGTYQWAASAGGSGYDSSEDLAVDATGTAVLVGQAVPTATFGPCALSTPAGTPSLFVARYGVPPTLTAVAPAAELPGQTVTLTGTYFGPGTAVSFGGVAAASVGYVSPTRLTAVVPAGATPGSSVVAVGPACAAVGLPASAFEVLQVYRSAAASGCLATAGTPVSGTGGAGKWVYLRLPGTGGAVVAAIEDTRNLGTVTASLAVLGTATTAAVRADGRIGRRYLDRNFALTATSPSFAGSTVRVRFYGLSSELARLTAVDAAATLAGLQASQYDGPNVDCQLSNNSPAGQRRLVAAPATVVSGADWFAAEVAVPDHFSEFYLTGASSPLPVELTTFTATAEGPAVRLAWRTASEKNSAHFEVQRSATGEAFEPIGEVAAQGTKATPTDYIFRDPLALLPSHPHTLYYRLRQVDLDGTASYSPVRVVTVGGPGELRLYPNPANAAVAVAGLRPGAPVQVLDALGRPVARATAEARGTARLVLPTGLAPGVYIVRSGAQARRLTVE